MGVRPLPERATALTISTSSRRKRNITTNIQETKQLQVFINQQIGNEQENLFCFETIVFASDA